MLRADVDGTVSEADGMNTDLMFSKASDEWATPQPLFDELDREFHFNVDVAASYANAKCMAHYTKENDALAADWRQEGFLAPPVCWMNPPYSKCREFIAKAALEADKGCTVVCLVPSRTDTRWWHDHVWFGSGPLDRVEVRFLKGRVKFGAGKNSAPFPSVVIIFRGAK